MKWAAVLVTVAFVGSLINAAAGGESFTSFAGLVPAAVVVWLGFWQLQTTRTRIREAASLPQVVSTWSLPDSREAARRGLASLLAKERSDLHYGQALVAAWSAGFRLELQGCWLRCLYVQVERPSVDLDLMKMLVGQAAEDAAKMARVPFGRCLAVVVAVAENVTDDLREGLSSIQVIARGFVSPVLVDVTHRQVMTVPIGERGAGFAPYRHEILTAVLGSQPASI